MDRNELFETACNGVLKVPLFPSKAVKKITDFNALKEYINQEIGNWANINFSHPRPFAPGAFYVNLGNYINRIDSQLVQENGEHAARNSINEIIRNLTTSNQPKISSFTREGALVIKVFKDDPLKARGIYDYFLNDFSGGMAGSDAGYLKGIIIGMFAVDSSNDLTEIVKNDNEIVESVVKNYTESADELKIFYQNRIKELEKEFDDFKVKYSNWKKAHTEEINNAVQEMKDDYENLRKQHQEYTRLKEPANYWNELYDEYVKKGRAWRLWATGTAVGFAGAIFYLLYHFPDILTPANGKLTATNIKGTILLTLGLSIFVYFIRLFVKLSISAYHLSRDAKERYQLSHVYLSLIDEKAINDNERDIVLQALFSRADTGLLKGDSNPTMPDGMIGQIVKHLKGN